jgi:NAD+ synthase
MRELNYKKIIERITLWISKFTEKAGAEGVILGLSGGIDSSVTAVLCLKALGRENVIGVIMPCNSFGDDLEDAMNLVEKFNLRYFKFELGNVYHNFLDIIDSKIPKNKLALGNVKPRLRMTTLYYVNQSLGNYLVVGTGNKSEILIGNFPNFMFIKISQWFKINSTISIFGKITN